MSLVWLQEGASLTEPHPLPGAAPSGRPPTLAPAAGLAGAERDPTRGAPAPAPRWARPEGADASWQLSPQTRLLPLRSRTTGPWAFMQDPAKPSWPDPGLACRLHAAEPRLGESPRVKIATRCSAVGTLVWAVGPVVSSGPHRPASLGSIPEPARAAPGWRGAGLQGDGSVKDPGAGVGLGGGTVTSAAASAGLGELFP